MTARVVRALGAAACIAFGSPAWAAGAEASYPSRPIRLVLPYPPGGGIDALARVLAPKLSAAMGQQWVVDNRGGAAGNLAVEIGVIGDRPRFSRRLVYRGQVLRV